MNAADGRRACTSKFGETRWTMVLMAARGWGQEAVQAWESLAIQYWKPLYAFCRQKGDSSEEAEDHVQGFFEMLLDRGSLRAVHPSRGRLRNWLVAAMDQHRCRRWRLGNARKRRPPGGFDPRDVSEVEEVLGGGVECEPERAFLRQWALDVLQQTRCEMQDRYVARGQAERFEHFWSRLTTRAASADHEALARRLGMTPGALSTALWQFRLDYQRTLRRVVRATIPEGESINDEVRAMIRAWS